jgi:hypothetical protein
MSPIFQSGLGLARDFGLERREIARQRGSAKARLATPSTPGHHHAIVIVLGTSVEPHQLMAEQQILRLKPPPRLEQVYDENPENVSLHIMRSMTRRQFRWAG